MRNYNIVFVLVYIDSVSKTIPVVFEYTSIKDLNTATRLIFGSVAALLANFSDGKSAVRCGHLRVLLRGEGGEQITLADAWGAFPTNYIDAVKWAKSGENRWHMRVLSFLTDMTLRAYRGGRL